MTVTTQELIAFARTIENQKLWTCTGATFTVTVMNERLSFCLYDDLGVSVRNLNRSSLDTVVRIFLRTKSFAPADCSGFCTKAAYALPVIEAYMRSMDESP